MFSKIVACVYAIRLCFFIMRRSVSGRFCVFLASTEQNGSSAHRIIEPFPFDIPIDGIYWLWLHIMHIVRILQLNATQHGKKTYPDYVNHKVQRLGARSLAAIFILGSCQSMCLFFGLFSIWFEFFVRVVCVLYGARIIIHHNVSNRMQTMCVYGIQIECMVIRQ